MQEPDKQSGCVVAEIGAEGDAVAEKPVADAVAVAQVCAGSAQEVKKFIAF